jgi:hypothetical protein
MELICLASRRSRLTASFRPWLRMDSLRPMATRLAAADMTKVPTRHFALLPLLLVVGACGTSEPTACDTFADRKLAISGAEYRGCAGEILAALDAIKPPLRAVVAETANNVERDAARRAYRRLRTLIRRTGIEADYRSMRPGTVIMKWPDGPVSAFNSAAFLATVQYGAVLSYPNADNFGQGVRAHDDARRYYRGIH